jgi:hypothetical protein
MTLKPPLLANMGRVQRVVIALKEGLEHVHIGHITKSLGACAKFCVIVWAWRCGIHSAILDLAHELRDVRFDCAVKVFQDATFVTHNATEVIGIEIVQAFIVCANDALAVRPFSIG